MLAPLGAHARGYLVEKTILWPQLRRSFAPCSVLCAGDRARFVASWWAWGLGNWACFQADGMLNPVETQTTYTFHSGNQTEIGAVALGVALRIPSGTLDMAALSQFAPTFEPRRCELWSAGLRVFSVQKP